MNKSDVDGTKPDVNEVEGKKALKGPPPRSTLDVILVGQDGRDPMIDQMRALLSTMSYRK